MFAPQIMVDSAPAQVWAGDGIGDGALLGYDANVSGPIDKNAIAREKPVAFVKTRAEVIHKFVELRNETLRQITDLAAHTCIRRGESRACQKLKQIVKFFALGERVEENGHCAKVERHRPEAQQM